ncbi:saccharopine dehydrogenase, partial [candidate division KSB1 bacterium 4572_119]
MKKIIVLGAGMVGSAIAIDLCKNYKITSVDNNLENLGKLNAFPIKTLTKDLSDPKVVQNIVADFDLVIGAVPGFMGFQTLKAVIEAEKNIVDISFFPENPFELDTLAKEKKVTAVMDCGVAPGMSNLILGYHNQRMEIDNFECYVGGLPFIRKWPYEYKAPFSPIDVIEEYIRPSRIMENGEIVIKPALSEPELIDFPRVGTLESFNTDGLRSLLQTMNIKNMKEKTLRYPGHIEIMRILRESGFLSSEPLDIGHQRVKPIELTSKLLFPMWQLSDKEEEFTIMKIVISGNEAGTEKKYTYHLFDKYDPISKTSSMARTTGYPCTAVARLMLDDDFKQNGINPPEFVGADEKCFAKIIAYL